ncbi:DUF2804 domain-containing protein [Marinobacter fonticola]|uniref:DUF2804 domain-containing protein n=1 Tax=Marinobacter fonticola TaxID=2603215 RepID=UPI0011E78847|nr:DUF2804 domain-containing protein [Marinobacter fonticola]
MELIGENGQPQYGEFNQPITHINYRDFDLRSVMDRPRPRWARYWAFNQFQFVSVQGADWLMGLAVVDLKLVSNAFIYIHDFRTGETREKRWLNPLAIGCHLDPFPEKGTCRFKRGGTEILIEGEGDNRRVSVLGEGIDLDLQLSDDRHPLRLCSRAGYAGWVFTRKSAGLPVGGRLRWGEKTYTIDGDLRGTVDWSCGFMRRETAWNWACLAGVTDSGRTVGLNLAAGVNETGVTENALWIDGIRIKLDLARFAFDRYEPGSSWRVTTSDGRVDLRFQPEGVRRERINAVLLASNFRQFAGTFNGTVTDNDGATLKIENMRGLIEDHFARW